jgi:hypothetical protein
MERKMKRLGIYFLVVLTSLALAVPVATGQAKKDPKEKKITGEVISAPADPALKLAPVAVRCPDGTYAVAENSVAKRIAKLMGKKAVVTGEIKEEGGKKIIVGWLVLPADAQPQ